MRPARGSSDLRRRAFAVVFASLATALANGPALAAPYLSFGGGVDVPSDAEVKVGSANIGTVETGSGFAVALAGGLDWGWIRTELRADIRRGDVERVVGSAASIGALPTGGQIGVLSLMPSLGFDWPLPILGSGLHADVGLGAAQLRDTTFDDWAFAWALGAGIHRRLVGPVGLDFAYRYTMLSDGFEVPGSSAVLDWSDHALLLSLRLTFSATGG